MLHVYAEVPHEAGRSCARFSAFDAQGAGGIERVMVASGTTSAPPIFVTRYPLDPADLAASIAPRESATAKTNHQVGDLIMLGFTLCKVTTAIARGEAITIGTNVTKTSVAAEIAALS